MVCLNINYRNTNFIGYKTGSKHKTRILLFEDKTATRQTLAITIISQYTIADS